MGWLNKAVKAFKKTTAGNISAFKKQGIKSLTLKRVTASNTIQEAGGYGLTGQKGTEAELAAKKARGDAADAQAATDAQVASKAAADAEAARVTGIETAKTDAVTALRAKMGLGGAAVVDSVAAPGAIDPAILAAQEAEKKRKAALLAAQQANLPKATLG